MDEAERCHELCYIAYGRLLARGTAERIIAEAGLTVWSARGDGLPALSQRLKAAPGVLSVAAFGTSLHVAGTDAAAIDAAIAPFRNQPGLRWSRSEANLEDVFISLISRERDNFEDAPA